jgi:phospholipid/cholesterol/gamma-HCH transport system substrate-binding protein
MRAGEHRRLPNHVVGLIVAVIVALGLFIAFAKLLNVRAPWAGGYEVKAVFTNAQNVRVKSPVRIAGVQVGEVTGVEHLTSDSPEFEAAVGKPPEQDAPPGQEAAVVTMKIDDEGRPIHEDASFRLRPRLFLEGNLFVDVRPGSPGSPEAPEDHVFPQTQTAVSVQLDTVLTSLQSDTRRNLQLFLQEFGDALIQHGGAEGFRELYRTSPGANKNTAIVNQAFLGTQPHDLSGLVKNLDSTVRALDADEAGLQNLVTNLRVVTGSFAAHDQDLRRAIALLPGALDAGRPALFHLNQSFPQLRAFAREALPGVRSTPETLDVATPFLRQIRGLVSRQELRGLVHDLRPTIPRLTKLTKRTIPFLDQSRALSSCFNEVIIPWSNDTVPNPPPGTNDPSFPAAGKVYEETGYGLSGIAGESRSGDANGQYIRVEAGGGTNTVTLPPNTYGVTDQLVGVTPFPLLGGNPAISSSAKTPFRPGAPCEKQEPPNLAGGTVAEPPEQETASASALEVPGLESQGSDYLEQVEEARKLREEGREKQADAIVKGILKDWLGTNGSSEILRSQLRALEGVR